MWIGHSQKLLRHQIYSVIQLNANNGHIYIHSHNRPQYMRPMLPQYVVHMPILEYGSRNVRVLLRHTILTNLIDIKQRFIVR